MVKNPPDNAGDKRDVGLILGLGRPPGVGNGNPLQYSCLENFMDRGAWWAMLHEVVSRNKTKSAKIENKRRTTLSHCGGRGQRAGQRC